MKYALENMHLNHVWSSAFQKWFCLTTSDLSFKEVSFHKMPAFKSQVNQTLTNFPGSCNNSDKRLTSASQQVYLPATASFRVAVCLYNTTNSQQGALRFHWNIITTLCCLGQPWLRPFTWFIFTIFTKTVPMSWPKFALPKAPGHSRLHRITVPCFILEITTSWF